MKLSSPGQLEDAGDHAGGIESILGFKLWDQQPLLRPRVDPSLPHLPWLNRGIEVLLHSLARLEFWLSPNGWLRAWVRLNLLLTIILTVLSVTVLPVVTAVLAEITGWTGMASDMAGSLTKAVQSLPPVAVTIGAIFLLLQIVRRYRSRHRRLGYFHSDPYEE